MLTDAKIRAAKGKSKPYKLGDGGQLYLYVTPAGGKHWRMNYTYGRSPKGGAAQKTLSIGSYPALTLLGARDARDVAKKMLREGKDPAVERKIAKQAQADANENTFQVVAERWFSLKSGWDMAKYREWLATHDRAWRKEDAAYWIKGRGSWSIVHAGDVIGSLDRDIFPEIGALPISVLKAPKVLEVLQKVEARGAIETAHRLRQRCSATFVYGVSAGLCDADPAASLGEALKDVPKSKPQRSIIDGLRSQEDRLTAVRQLLIDCEAERCRAVTKFALRLVALTAVRPGELAGLPWTELHDLEGKEPLWIIPPERMKGDEDRKTEVDGEHLVPLSRQAVELLLALRQITGDHLLCFPSERHVHRSISENTLRALLIRAGYYQRHVPHGFRAAFSTYMNEKADREWREAGLAGVSPDRAIIDLMLAHVPKNKVEGAYNRADYMPRRRELAQEWADLIVGDMWGPEVRIGGPIRWAPNGPGRPRLG